MPDNTTWLEIRLETTEDYDSDRLEEALFAAGALSVTLTSKIDEVILIEPTPGELPLWEQGMIVTGLFDQGFDPNTAIPILKACLATEALPLLGTNSLADRDWASEWTQYFRPIQFGNHLWICPSNQKVPSNSINDQTQIITLDPGLAFGTGSHPTTAMVLEYLATHHIIGQQVIDYGCGSGILGIAALKMGANHVIMTDIDPQALTTTQDNARINHVDQAIDCYLPEHVPHRSADLLIANILLAPLLELKSTFIGLCHSQTTLILTGLLHSQTEQIMAHYQTDFDDFHLTHQGDWAMISAKRRCHSTI